MSNGTSSTLAPGKQKQGPFRRKFFLAAAATAMGANLVYALTLEVVATAVSIAIVCLLVLAFSVVISRALLQPSPDTVGTTSGYSRLGALASAFFATSALFSGMIFLCVGMVAIAFEST